VIGSQRSGVFLSYARADDEEFAATLRERIGRQAPDIVIKQDRILLEGGVGWWKQLTEAIDSVEFLVLVMTPLLHAVGDGPQGMAIRPPGWSMRLSRQRRA
jgi:hypothetical protein